MACFLKYLFQTILSIFHLLGSVAHPEDGAPPPEYNPGLIPGVPVDVTYH